MSEVLKDRVNSSKINFVFIVTIFLSLCISKSFAQDSQQQPFDYTKTVWIINVMEGSGTVYGRPGPEDYNPRQGFIYIYEVLIKYVYSMRDLNSSTPPTALTVTHELILMNGVTEQRLLIGEHWISDERNIAAMSELDYNNLKEWLGTREKNQDYKKNPPIDRLVKGFRNNTSPEIESFDKYFNSNQTSSVITEIQKPTANTQTSANSSATTNADNQSSQMASQHQSNGNAQSSIRDIKISPQFNHDESSTNALKKSPDASENITKSEADNANFSLGLKIVIGLLLAACMLRIWKRRKH